VYTLLPQPVPTPFFYHFWVTFGGSGKESQKKLMGSKNVKKTLKKGEKTRKKGEKKRKKTRNFDPFFGLFVEETPLPPSV